MSAKRKDVDEPESSASNRNKVAPFEETHGVSALSEECPDNPPGEECPECDECFSKLDAMAINFSTYHEENFKQSNKRQAQEHC